MALANSFLASPAAFVDEPTYPLDVAVCPSCSLVQLLDSVSPEALFRDYIYVTGTSDTIRQHNAAYAAAVVERLGLGPGDLVVEAASNDGSLLHAFQAHGVRVLGVEPARNIAAQAEATGIETLPEFFSPEVAREVRARHGPARAILANNVLAHVPDPCGFLRGAADLLADDGMIYVEVPYLGEFLDRTEYDTIYHEHLSYFSVTALLELCQRAGLALVSVEHFPVHGGTIRLQAGPAARHPTHGESALALAAREAARGWTSPDRYHAFAEEVARHRTELVGLLTGLQAARATVAGYGAPAKGNTLLNYCGIRPELLPYTVDKNPRKVGRYTPGTHIPVLAVDAVIARQPDYLLILAWNFAQEIMEQQDVYRRRGGRFIVPIPRPEIV